jgi:hypothetical protein
MAGESPEGIWNARRAFEQGKQTPFANAGSESPSDCLSEKSQRDESE